jgi:hypothetical protein
MKHTTKQFTWGRGLLVAAALVQGVQYAQAFALVHDDLGVFSYAGGALAGLVVVGAVAYAGNALPRVKAKNARRWGMALFVLALVLSPLVLTPVNYYGMDAGLRAAIGGYAWALAGLLAALPEIALGLVALVDRQMMTLPATVSDAVSDAQRPSATLAAKSSDAQRRSAKLPATLYRCDCGFTDADRFVMSGHKGKCPVYQAKKSGQPIPVELPARAASVKASEK